MSSTNSGPLFLIPPAVSFESFPDEVTPGMGITQEMYASYAPSHNRMWTEMCMLRRILGFPQPECGTARARFLTGPTS